MLGTWHNNCFDTVSGRGRYENDTKGTANVMLLDTMDVLLVNRTIYGIFPLTFPDIPLGSDTSALVNMAITWWFDFWDDDVGGSGTGP